MGKRLYHIILILLLFALHLNLSAKITPVNLKCEYLTHPLGVDVKSPRLYWQLISNKNSQYQLAYELMVSNSEDSLKNNIGNIYHSGFILSNQNTHVVFDGSLLESASEYFWKVRVWNQDTIASDWSEPAYFSTGLYTEADWENAQWIGWRSQEEWAKEWWRKKEIEQKCHELYLPSYFGARMNMWERHHFHHTSPYDPSPLYRKEFKTNKKVKKAFAYISGLGYYELFLNGKKVGNHVLDPGWTDYRKTILYETYEITELINHGENAIGVMLGRGNYGMIAIDHWGFYKKHGYIGQPKLKCRIHLVFDDGSEENIVSDLSWKVTGGPIIYDCPHMGEIYDATIEIENWNKAGINDSGWDIPKLAPSPGGELVSQMCQPMRVVERFHPREVLQGKFKSQLADAGTNMAGWIRLKVNAPKGTQIIIYYGENENPLDHDQPGGYQQMAYIAKGEPGEIAECRFSYKGFRYVCIKGHKKILKPEDIEFCQVNSDVPEVGSFHCSNQTLNEIHDICTKSMISNLHSIPTDCPHREKNGWMGDAITGIEYGMANYDLAALMTKFTRDMFDTQDSTGRMGHIAPDNSIKKGRSSLWSSACVHVPWYMYQYYGDTRLFEAYWLQMKMFTQSVWKYNQVADKPGIFKDVFSDWSSPHGNRGAEGGEVYATMNFYLVLQRMAKIANIVGDKDAIPKYEKEAEDVKKAINKWCYDKKGIFKGIHPTEYRQGPNTLALHYGIADEKQANVVYTKLLEDIEENRDSHFYGGIFTGHALWDLIPKNEGAQLAFDVAVNDSYPGYGYMLKNGATTVWEHWEDRSSHIHHFMGFVDNYLIRHVAGIDETSSTPGFKLVHLEPKFSDSIYCANATYNSINGLISINWKKNQANELSLQIEVPVNCKTKLYLPDSISDVKIDGNKTKALNTEYFNNKLLQVDVEKKVLNFDSGNYEITCKL